MKDLSKMTYLEKLDYLRELNPFYRETSVVFSFTEKKIEQEINDILFPKPIVEKVTKVKKPKSQPKTAKQLKNENKLLSQRIEKQQEEIVSLKEEIKSLKKKLKRVGEIINAKN